MGHRESPGIGPDSAAEPRSTPGRRFARLVGSPAARKVALPRLLAAAGLATFVIALAALGGWLLLHRLTRYVDGRPEHRIGFSRIELSPEPGPWVSGGRLKVLEDVRAVAKLGETVSLLDLDLKELEKAFRLCSWVKDVIRVDRTHYGRLVVELAYRKPVAVVVLGKSNPKAYPIDEEAVALPIDDIDWKTFRSPFEIHGIPEPLIEVRGLDQEMPPKFGLDWKKQGSEGRDEMVFGAARLAHFLQGRGRSTPKGRTIPVFAEIRLPVEPNHPFFLSDSRRNLVRWGKPPGDEKPGEPSSEDRWKMLLDWVDRNGLLDAKSPRYLSFDRSEAKVVDGGEVGRRPK